MWKIALKYIFLLFTLAVCSGKLLTPMEMSEDPCYDHVRGGTEAEAVPMENSLELH